MILGTMPVVGVRDALFLRVRYHGTVQALCMRTIKLPLFGKGDAASARVEAVDRCPDGLPVLRQGDSVKVVPKGRDNA